ncbi:MAG: hypothetical protein Q4D74_03425 [Comamonadaceae bacterium]|nr:hypothetical protein [Comamonadaceae bacterium]
MKHTTHALAAAALFGAAISAHAQAALTLACPTAAAGPATPLEFATGPGWEFKKTTDAAWAPAHTGYKHNNWYPAGSNPALGTWLTVSDPATPVNTDAPFDFRSPSITIDPRIDLTTVVTTVERTADNHHDDVGVVNNGTPPAGTFANAGTYSGFGTLQSITPALAWATGANQLLLRIRNAENIHTTNPDPDINTPPSHGPMGVYTKVTLNATCKAAPPSSASVQAVPVDNPWALMLVALGVGGLAARKMRQRRHD